MESTTLEKPDTEFGTFTAFVASWFAEGKKDNAKG